MFGVSLMALSATIAPQLALAEEAGPLPATANNNVQRFEPEFFKAYQVTNALEMVFNVPGFNFDQGEDARGFSGTAPNVLIDGQRIVTKDNVQNSISSISASQVDHIELITGGAEGIDMMGHRQVVNIVRKSDAKATQSVVLMTRIHEGSGPQGITTYNYSKNSNNISTEFYIGLFQFIDMGTNDGTRFTHYPNAPTDILTIRQEAGGDGAESRASHSRPLLGGKITLNGSYEQTDYNGDSRYIDTAVATEHMDWKEHKSNLGISYERKIGSKLNFELNLLRRYNRVRFDDVYVEGADTSVFNQFVATRENIISGKIIYTVNPKLSVNVGTESVFNGRDTQSRFTVNNTNQNVPVTTVTVEEDRVESYVTTNWKPTDKWSLEGELRVENSTISVPQSNRADSFTYYKPRFQAVYSLNDHTKLTFKTQKRVEQLSFDAFASSIELQNSYVIIGNTSLVPTKVWAYEFLYERTFWEKGAFTISLQHYTAKDTTDQIAVIDGTRVYSALGNLGDGTRDQIDFSLDTPIDKLGDKGGTFRFFVSLRDSKVFDPVVGRERPISWIEPIRYSFGYTKNITEKRIKYGFEVEQGSQEEIYRANEFIDWSSEPYLGVWGEYKTPNKLTFTARFNIPFGQKTTRSRTVYEGLREVTPVKFIEREHHRFKPMLMMRVRKEF